MRTRPRSRRRVAAVALGAVLLLVGTSACSAGSRLDRGDESPEQRRPPAFAEPACAAVSTAVARDLPYATPAPGVDPSALSLDLYRAIVPEGCNPAPIVVFAHGGGFSIGDKTQTVSDKSVYFTSAGWHFVSINYRLSPRGLADQPGQVQHPAHVSDVADAIAWVTETAAQFGGDPSRIVLMGHSAGAFLVSLAATDTQYLRAAGVDESSIRCVVSLDTEYSIPDIIGQGGPREAVYRNAFGADPGTWHRASPITHAGDAASSAQFLIVTQGSPQRTEASERFAVALQDGGTRATLIDVTPLTHAEINAAVGEPGDHVLTPQIAEFLADCAGSDDSPY